MVPRWSSAIATHWRLWPFDLPPEDWRTVLYLIRPPEMFRKERLFTSVVRQKDPVISRGFPCDPLCPLWLKPLTSSTETTDHVDRGAIFSDPHFRRTTPARMLDVYRNLDYRFILRGGESRELRPAFVARRSKWTHSWRHGRLE